MRRSPRTRAESSGALGNHQLSPSPPRSKGEKGFTYYEKGAALASTVQIDPDGNVQEQLRDILAANAVRVIDLFHDWDDDGDGRVSKKEFRKAMRMLGLNVPRHDVDALFDTFDPDGGGSIDYGELNKALKRRVALDPSLRAGSMGTIELKAKNKSSRGVEADSPTRLSPRARPSNGHSGTLHGGPRSPRHRPSPSPQGVHSGRGGHGGRGALRKLRPSASMADEAARRIQQGARLLLLWRSVQRRVAQRAAVACIQRCQVRARQNRVGKVDLVKTLQQRYLQTMAVISLQAHTRGWLVRREMRTSLVPLRVKMWQMQRHLDAVTQLVNSRLEQERLRVECGAKTKLTAAWRTHQDKDSTKLRRFQQACAASRIAAAYRGYRERKRGESIVRRRKQNESPRRRGSTKMRPRGQPIQAARPIANSPKRTSRELSPANRRSSTGPPPRRRVASGSE